MITAKPKELDDLYIPRALLREQYIRGVSVYRSILFALLNYNDYHALPIFRTHISCHVRKHCNITGLYIKIGHAHRVVGLAFQHGIDKLSRVFFK